MQVDKPDDLVAGTCPFVSGPSEVWAAAGAVMSGALRGQDRNYWTEGGWQRELALGANRCCNHKEIHNLWIKYEERGQQEWRMLVTSPLLLGQSVCCELMCDWLVSCCCNENLVDYLNLCWFLKNFRDATKSLKKKNFMHEDSCSEHTADSLFRSRGSLDAACYVKVF